MEVPQVPQDDLMDVMEMVMKMENYISELMRDNEKTISISALMSASINCTLAQCETLDEVIFYRNLFVSILDSSIRTIKIKGPEKPEHPQSSSSSPSDSSS